MEQALVLAGVTTYTAAFLPRDGLCLLSQALLLPAVPDSARGSWSRLGLCTVKTKVRARSHQKGLVAVTVLETTSKVVSTACL